MAGTLCRSMTESTLVILSQTTHLKETIRCESLILGSKQESLFVEFHFSILYPLKTTLGVYIAFLGLLKKDTCSLVGFPSAFLHCSLMKGVWVFEGLFFILDICVVFLFCWSFLTLLFMMRFENVSKLCY